jgi:hypothetical protein
LSSWTTSTKHGMLVIDKEVTTLHFISPINWLNILYLLMPSCCRTCHLLCLGYKIPSILAASLRPESPPFSLWSVTFFVNDLETLPTLLSEHLVPWPNCVTYDVTYPVIIALILSVHRFFILHIAFFPCCTLPPACANCALFDSLKCSYNSKWAYLAPQSY